MPVSERDVCQKPYSETRLDAESELATIDTDDQMYVREDVQLKVVLAEVRRYESSDIVTGPLRRTDSSTLNLSSANWNKKIEEVSGRPPTVGRPASDTTANERDRKFLENAKRTPRSAAGAAALSAHLPYVIRRAPYRALNITLYFEIAYQRSPPH
ncbi:hypothetical protein EVAR_60572_1 [Eumeta japonica]|uniref:Uncharacterized protein n=1 Tax=Eumeta variegata TaxID=151549 RepID=A0A4C1YHY8_EUMVA|nr:hypothetical protein EVAR_60572_1 [Eumeta japonica]